MDFQTIIIQIFVYTISVAIISVVSTKSITDKSKTDCQQLLKDSLEGNELKNQLKRQGNKCINQQSPNQMNSEMCSNMTDEASMEKSNRQKRDVKDFNIRLFLVIDYSVLQIWYNRTNIMDVNSDRKLLNQMKEFYQSIVKEMDNQLRTLIIPNINFRVSLANIYINVNSTDQIHQGSKNKSKILKDFQKWLKHQNLPSYDHALLFIDNRLIENDHGRNQDDTWLSTICTNRSISLVPEDFNFNTVTMATHELAHSLGIQHDGEGNECLPGYYLMTDDKMDFTTKTSINLRKFSPCSSNYITEKLQLDEKSMDCLKSYFNPSQPSPRPLGQICGPDCQCRHAIGRNSYVCRTLYQSNYNSVCTGLWCTNEAGNCTQILPYDGTSCGNEKWCLNKVCTNDEKAPRVPDGCPFRDQISTIPGVNLTCSQVSKGKSVECFKMEVALACCQICPTIKCNNETCCKREDTHPKCAALEPHICYHQGMLQTCCKTCKKHCSKNIPDCPCGDKHSDCVNITRIRCYKHHHKCCESCYELQNPKNKGCEYGDRRKGCSAENCQFYDPYLLNKVCCETCHSFRTQQIISDSDDHASAANRISPKHIFFFIPFLLTFLFSFMLNGNSPNIFAPNSDGSYRFVKDYHKINALTKTDYFLIPRIDNCIDKISNIKYSSRSDL